jgi:26S proteasome regulatory subunit T4
MNPELFLRVGIKPPKGVLLYGPPGTGKTLLARAVAATLSTNFLKVVASAIVDKYIGESARVIREMFGYAREHEPCIIFMDEIDAIGGRRFSEGTSADREIQRTLMELLNQLDGFDYLGKTKVIFATNRVRRPSFPFFFLPFFLTFSLPSLSTSCVCSPTPSTPPSSVPAA